MFDFGPSLLDEMDLMFRSMTASGDTASLNPPLTPNFDNVNKRNELTEKLSRKSQGVNGMIGGGSGMSGGELLSCSLFHSESCIFHSLQTVSTYKSKKKPTSVKPISVKDEKILNQAIEIANEMSARYVKSIDTTWFR